MMPARVHTPVWWAGNNKHVVTTTYVMVTPGDVPICGTKRGRHSSLIQWQWGTFHPSFDDVSVMYIYQAVNYSHGAVFPLIGSLRGYRFLDSPRSRHVGNGARWLAVGDVMHSISGDYVMQVMTSERHFAHIFPLYTYRVGLSRVVVSRSKNNILLSRLSGCILMAVYTSY